MAALILVQDGNTDGLKSLLQVDKSTIDAVDSDGNTALMIASWTGKDECVDALIQAGAKLNVTNNSKYSALILACRDGHGAVAKALLDAGARHDLVSNIGYTALDYADQQEHTLIKKILVRHLMYRFTFLRSTSYFFIMPLKPVRVVYQIISLLSLLL